MSSACVKHVSTPVLPEYLWRWRLQALGRLDGWESWLVCVLCKRARCACGRVVRCVCSRLFLCPALRWLSRSCILWPSHFLSQLACAYRDAV